MKTIMLLTLILLYIKYFVYQCPPIISRSHYIQVHSNALPLHPGPLQCIPITSRSTALPLHPGRLPSHYIQVDCPPIIPRSNARKYQFTTNYHNPMLVHSSVREEDTSMNSANSSDELHSLNEHSYVTIVTKYFALPTAGQHSLVNPTSSMCGQG